MNWKNFGLATAAGAAAMLVVGGLWEGVSAGHFFYTQVHSSLGGNALLVAAYVLLGAMMAYAFPFAHRNGPPYLEGLKLGVFVGVLMVFPHGLALAATRESAALYVSKNTLWHAFEQGVGGIAIAYTYATLLKGKAARR